LAILDGRRIATNLDLFVEHLVSPFRRDVSITRTSDVPTLEDLDNLGLGYEGEFKGDAHNGLIVFDECAKWLNSRGYRDKGRQALVDWMIHARKKRWDIIFIIQDVNAMDKQFRELFCEHVVYCRRLDRFNVPIIGPAYKAIAGKPLKGPRMHVGIVKYGEKESSPNVESWWYRGTALFDAYDTEQGFASDSFANRSMLTPWHVKGRYTNKKRFFKDVFVNSSKLPFLIGGIFLGGLFVNAVSPDPYELSKGVFRCTDSYEELIGCDITPSELKRRLTLTSSSEDAPDAPPAVASEEVDVNPFYISSYVWESNGDYSYFFTLDGEPYYPTTDGWFIEARKACSAIAIKRSNSAVRRQIQCVNGDEL
jgi:hypothetical protein